MWIIGLLIGLILGGAVEQEEGAMFGAALGTIAGLLISLRRRVRNIEDLNERVRTLEQDLENLRQQAPGSIPTAPPTGAETEGTVRAEDAGAVPTPLTPAPPTGTPAQANGTESETIQPVPSVQPETAFPQPPIDFFDHRRFCGME